MTQTRVRYDIIVEIVSKTLQCIRGPLGPSEIGPTRPEQFFKVVQTDQADTKIQNLETKPVPARSAL